MFRHLVLLSAVVLYFAVAVTAGQERRLISIGDQAILKAATAATMAAEVARVKAATATPDSWRLDPDLTAFYNPSGMSQGQIDTYEAAHKAAFFTTTSRQKDILTTCALVVRAKGLAAWNAMTTPQKVTATLAECDVWANIRDFVETNVP